MTDYVVGPNDSPYGYVAQSGDTIEVLPGGETSSALVNAGGTETVSAGPTGSGFAYFTTISDGGVQNIDSAASAFGTQISFGGTENVSGDSDFSSISGTQNVAGGSGYFDNIYSGGVQNVSLGGVETDTIIFAGGIQNIYPDPGSSFSASVYGTENVFGGASTSAVVSSGGTENVSMSGTAISTQIDSGGSQVVSSGGTADTTLIQSGGVESVLSGGVESGAIVSSGGTLSMAGGTATDVSLQNGAIVDLTTVGYQTGDTATIIGGKLTLQTSGGRILDQSVSVSGGQTGAQFSVAKDTSGGTVLTETEAVCYVAGTRLLTPIGERRVEDLGIGDVVVTRFSGFKAIRWIGRQTFGVDEVCGNRERMPVRIRAGAFADGVPARDLFVSPGHSMLIDGTLVLAKCLVNGITITQEALPVRLEYFQLDLAAHDCVVAEGTWAETFADGDGLREKFHNVREFNAMFPDHRPPERLVPLCAPRPLRGAELGAVLLPIVTRATTGLRPGRLRGFVDAVNGDWRLEGWAQDEDHPQTPVDLEILVGGKVIGTVLACDFRKDLLEALGEGNLSFVFDSPIRLHAEALSTLEVRRAVDAAPLRFSGKMQQCLEKLSKPAVEKPRLSLVRERGSQATHLQSVG
jgi:autotransporter passenger strand-loop-strand repeat protein